MTIKNALNNILEGNLDAMRQNFSSALTTKAVEKLEERKIEIAKNYFGQMMEQVETLEEKTIASKKAKKGTKYKVKAKNPDKEGSEIELRQGKRVKDKGDYDRGAGAFFMKTGTYDSAEDMLKTVKEEKVDESIAALLAGTAAGLAGSYAGMKSGLIPKGVDKASKMASSLKKKLTAKKKKVQEEKSEKESSENLRKLDAIRKDAAKKANDRNSPEYRQKQMRQQDLRIMRAGRVITSKAKSYEE